MKVTDYSPRAGYFDTLLQPRHKVVVEVGVSAGAHAHALLQFNSNIERLHLVDPWKDNIGFTEGYCKGRLESAGFRSRVVYWKMGSLEAVEKIGPVDAVYFDQQHDSKVVHHDLIVWWLLLKSGGIIGYRNYGDPEVRVGVNWFLDNMFSPDRIADLTYHDTYSGEMIINKL